MDLWFSPLSSSSTTPSSRGGARIAIAIAGVSAFLSSTAMTTAAAETSPAVEEYAIVVSPDVVTTSMNFERVRRMFMFRERYWKPGRPVKLIFSESGVEPQSFLLEKIYRMDYLSLRRLIVEKLYQEEIDLAPKVVASDDVAVAFVASGRGLIALVSASAAQRGKAKVVAIDGRLPGDPAYRLRR